MSYTWKFFRAGGFNQVVLNSGTDLLNLDQLDQKLWVALACPTTGVEFDKTTLALIDTDKDGRIRVPELIAATKWAAGLLKNPDDLLKGSSTLRPAAINDATPEGKLIANFARQVLGKTDTGEVTFDEAANAAQTFAAKPFNGDGIVPADSASDDATKAVIADIINCVGADTDASGKPGVSQARVDQFFAAAAAYSDWWKKAEGDATVLPLGLNTEVAAAAVKAVKSKVDDYFARGRLAAFDPRSVNALNRDEKEYAALGAKDLTSNHADIASLPLAQVGATTPLPLTQGINPAWAGAIAELQTHDIVPLLGAERCSPRRIGMRSSANSRPSMLERRQDRRRAEKIGFPRPRNPGHQGAGNLDCADRQGQGRGRQFDRRHWSAPADSLSSRHGEALPQLRQFRRFLWPERQGDFPGRNAVS